MLHTSPGQQSAVVVQLPLHGYAHVPFVTPGGMSHDPMQQSAFVVQMPPSRTQDPEPQTPLSEHEPEQHSAPYTQRKPFAMQYITRVQRPVHMVIAQHCPSDSHASESRTHCGASAQADTHVPPTHAASPQQVALPAHDPVASTQAGRSQVSVVALHVSSAQQVAPLQGCPAVAHAPSWSLVASLHALAKNASSPSNSGRLRSHVARAMNPSVDEQHGTPITDSAQDPRRAM